MLSIIIPTHNRLEMLKELLKSLEKQTFQDIEVIIVSDNCSDGTNNFLLSTQFPSTWKYIINEIPLNAGKSRRKGFLESKGEYVAFIDDDDYFIDPHFYERAISIFSQYPELSVVAANSINKCEDTLKYEKVCINIEGYVKGMEYMSGFQFKWYKPNPSFAVFRREKLIAAGIDNMYMVNDCPLYMRALLVGDIYIESDPVGIYRLHANNISKSISADFIIENLEEKNYIYHKLKKKNVDFSISLWWYKIVRITIDYFLGANPSKVETFKVLLWCKRHSHFSILLILYLLKISYSKKRMISLLFC